MITRVNGLGNWLYNESFSIWLGEAIDSAMDGSLWSNISCNGYIIEYQLKKHLDCQHIA